MTARQVFTKVASLYPITLVVVGALAHDRPVVVMVAGAALFSYIFGLVAMYIVGVWPLRGMTKEMIAVTRGLLADVAREREAMRDLAEVDVHVEEDPHPQAPDRVH